MNPMTPLLFEMICDDMENGATLRSCCVVYGIHRGVFARYRDRDEERQRRFDSVMIERSHERADEIIDISRDPLLHPQDKKVRIHALENQNAHWNPARYGAKIDINDSRNKKPISLEQLYDTFTPALSVDPSVTTH